MTIESDLLAIASAGLPAAPPPRGGWDARIDAVLANGLAGLFSSSAAAGLVDIDAAMASRLQQQIDIEATRAVQLEGELLRLTPALERLGAVVMGGPVLAHGAYPDPLFRPFSHLDLLVAGRRMPEAVSVFAHYGYHRAPTATGSALDARVGKAFVLQHPGGVEIRLHRTLAAGSIGDEAGRPAAGHREVMIGPHPVPAPSWEAHLLECTLDAVGAAGLARPLALRDIAEVVHHPALDPGAAVALADKWQVARPVGYSLRTASEGLGLDLPAPFAELARRSAEARPAMVALAGGPDHVTGPENGDAGSSTPPAHTLGASAHAGDAWAPAPASPVTPANIPALPVASPVPTNELATVDLPVRTTPSPVRTVHRNGTPLVAGGVAGRQGDWTSARPPRQGTNRARSRHVAHGTGGNGDRAGDDSDGPAGPTDPPSSEPSSSDAPSSDRPLSNPAPGTRSLGARPARNGLSLGFAGGAVLLANAICTQFGNDGVGIVLVPLAGLLLAGAAGRRIARRHPGEEWVGRWLVLAVAVKLTASYFKYHTLINDYDGVGDAIDYDAYGRDYAMAWLGRGGTAPDLEHLRQHNFVRWFTGVVYYVVGLDMVTGFLVFGLLAMVGSYLWYRATVESVPNIDKRLYLVLVLFLPSMAYWPSGIGKESLMQLAIGMVALATAHVLRQRLVTALVIGAPGGWLMWAVRPHMLAMVMAAGGCAYLVGRVRSGTQGLRGFIGRPVGLLVVALIVGFTVVQGAEFLGIENLSIDSIEAELDEQSERSGGGGSDFDSGGNSLNPLNLPEGAVTVLLRPFPWETDSSLQLLASLEGTLLAALIFVRLSSLGVALTRARETPFLLYCWVLILLFATAMSSYSNFGILVRQRSLVLPALFVLLAVRPSPAAPVAPRRPATTGAIRAGS